MKPIEHKPSRRQFPSSTYRLQLHGGFTLDDAADKAEYLAALGVSHLYASPYLQATPGSKHGYDPVDWSRVNIELGGEEAHQRFCQRLGEAGLGQILDIVPNHMALATNNRYWWDVLENGPRSRYADYFDIDWEPDEARLRNKVLVPVLCDQYGHELEAGEIKLAREDMQFQVRYRDSKLPIAPESVPVFLACAAKSCNSDALAFLADSFARLPQPAMNDRAAILARHRDKTVLMGLMHRCCAEEPKSYACMDDAIAQLNKNVEALDAFLQQQNYRLAYWRVAGEDLGYRRFFDVNTLIGVRVERENVFEETHERILEWLRDGVIDGVRVDHPDGLRDPQQYLERLRRTCSDGYIVVEKILQRGEQLRQDWPVQGCTGYEFLDQVNGLLVNADGLQQLDQSYRDFTGEQLCFEELAHEKKLNITQDLLGSDVNRLTDTFLQVCENDRNHRDYTRADVRRALREIAACFPVYRSYVLPARSLVEEPDTQAIHCAVQAAQQRRTDVDPRLFAFIEQVLTLQRRGTAESEFLLRFQQFTSPVMAKGVEDTTFYCYNRLIALNEVGGNPGRAPLSVDDFHAENELAQRTHPYRMLTLTTHDTKRSEDVRARQLVLSEMPQQFAAAASRWQQQNERHNPRGLLDRNTEWYYYQTLLGAWPLSEDRAIAHMEKAAREAKVHTSWTKNNQEFEQAMRDFVHATLADHNFVTEIEQMMAAMAPPAASNSLAQTLLKYTAPGVPDLYQGAELWDYRLVDPDNRSDVDFALRARLLREVAGMTVEAVMARMAEGLPKLWTIAKALAVRKQLPQCFNEMGSYSPLLAQGACREHVAAYTRGDAVAAIVPRLPTRVRDGWNGTTLTLPQARWRNVLTGECVAGGEQALDALLKKFPVALLVREGATHA